MIAKLLSEVMPGDKFNLLTRTFSMMAVVEEEIKNIMLEYEVQPALEQASLF